MKAYLGRKVVVTNIYNNAFDGVLLGYTMHGESVTLVLLKVNEFFKFRTIDKIKTIQFEQKEEAS
jgi:hypothetical protein